MSIDWKVPPSVLAREAARYGDLLQTAVGRALIDIAQTAETEMRVGAKWRNISGNARRGLRVEIEKDGDRRILMHFIHSVEYGVYLELAHGGKYAILYPTLLATLPVVRSRVRALGLRASG